MNQERAPSGAELGSAIEDRGAGVTPSARKGEEMMRTVDRRKPGTPPELLSLDSLSAKPDPRHEVCGREEPLGSVCVWRACAVACGSSFGFLTLLRS